MDGAIEAAGDAMTGAIVARAVEPSGASVQPHEANCLNCATTLIGPHCHSCGQAAHVHRTLGGLWHDIAHGVFHFEGKVWRTLPMLAFRPGVLTRLYVQGQRVRFVSPLALFLFSVFLMFAVFGSVGGPIRNADGSGLVKIDRTRVDTALRDARATTAELERRRAALVARGGGTADLDRRLAALREEVSQISAASALTTGDLSNGIVLPKSIKISSSVPGGEAKIREALKNPKYTLYKLQSSAYKLAWVIIPLSLPFMWLMFAWRRTYRLYDHAIFVTYSLASVMLLFVAMALVAAMGVTTSWAVLIVPLHMFVQLRQAYQLGLVSTIWRTVALMFVCTFVLVVFAAALLALDVLG